MTSEDYQKHRDGIREGRLAQIQGRTAATLDELDEIIKFSGETPPPTPTGEDGIDADLNGDGIVDDLEKMNFATLQTTGATLGLTIKVGTSKKAAIEAIRAAQTGEGIGNLAEHSSEATSLKPAERA